MAAMHAATQPTHQPIRRGIRPFDLGRDLRPVARLIAEAFADDLDAQGQAALRELRILGYMSGLIRFLNRTTTADFQQVFGGFVWVEDGRVVGNVTVQQMGNGSGRWQIANVAVEPSFRGRGIARALMEHALDYIREMGGAWAVLQVRADNQIARGLYERLGFQVVGGVAEFRRDRPPRGLTPPEIPGLAPFHPTEGHRLYELVRSQDVDREWWRTLRPADYQMTPEARLGEWLSRIVGRDRVLRMAVRDFHGRFQAALVLHARRWRGGEHRLRLWARPEVAARYEADLVHYGLAALASYPAWPVQVKLSIRQEHAIRALEALDFVNVHTLLTMRRALR